MPALLVGCAGGGGQGEIGACPDEAMATEERVLLPSRMEPGSLAWFEVEDLGAGGRIADEAVTSLTGESRPAEELPLGRQGDVARALDGRIAVDAFLLGVDLRHVEPEVRHLAVVAEDGDVEFLGRCAQMDTATLRAAADHADVEPAVLLRAAILDPGGPVGGVLFDPDVLSGGAPVPWSEQDPYERALDLGTTPSAVYEALDVVQVDVVGARRDGYLCSRSSLAWGEECLDLVTLPADGLPMVVHAPPGEAPAIVVLPEPSPAPRGAGEVLATIPAQLLARGEPIGLRLVDGGAVVLVP